MQVTWDPKKAESNFKKHKIRFSDAEMVLYDRFAMTLEDQVIAAEQRFASIGSDAVGRVIVIVYSYRADTIRLISAQKRHRRKGNNMKKEYNFENAKRGQVLPAKGKTRITIYLDTDILEDFRERADQGGYGYQTLINEALREYLSKSGKPLNEEVIRQVIREELDRATHH